MNEYNAGTTSLRARRFDSQNVNWSDKREYNALFLHATQNYFNEQLHKRGHVFLNEIYDFLGFKRSQYGALHGWILDAKNQNHITFEITELNADDKPYALLIDFNVDGIIYNKI